MTQTSHMPHKCVPYQLNTSPKNFEMWGCATAPLHNHPLGHAILTTGTMLSRFPCNEWVVEKREPCFLPSNTTIFHIKSDFCLPALMCAMPQFNRFHLCNHVQPCATKHATRGAHRTIKKEESIQCEHIWTMHYKSYITRARTHPPSLESLVITTMEPHFKVSLSHRRGQACQRCTRVAYNSIAFPNPTRTSMQMICIEEETGSCIDQAISYESLPPMCPCTGLDFPPTQITRREKVSPIEITNGDFTGESTTVVAMSMKGDGGSPRAMHQSKVCVGQRGEVLSHNFLYTSHRWLRFGGPCRNCNLLARAWKCLNGPNKEPPIVSAMSLHVLPTPCLT